MVPSDYYNTNKKTEMGYARPIGSTDSCRVELWALRDGLVMAKEMGLNSLVIELDALSVVLLMTNNSVNLLMEPLLTDCRNTC